MQNVSPYKTAAELGIERWEHDGLVALIGPLSRNELRFHMASWHSECGTVHCIGGWVEMLAHKTCWDSSGDDNLALHRLYYPAEDMAHNAWKATAPQAARAIVNFLTLGDPRWDDVMREPA